MSWQNAKQIAESWAEKNLPADLNGQVLQLVDFANDAECRRFYTDRDLGFHQMITRALARIARQRGARIAYVVLSERDYIFSALPAGFSGQSERTAYAEKCQRLLWPNHTTG
jgi:hypothetical protein